jgi:hypothetical protein
MNSTCLQMNSWSSSKPHGNSAASLVLFLDLIRLIFSAPLKFGVVSVLLSDIYYLQIRNSEITLDTSLHLIPHSQLSTTPVNFNFWIFLAFVYFGIFCFLSLSFKLLRHELTFLLEFPNSSKTVIFRVWEWDIRILKSSLKILKLFCLP